MFGGVVTHTTLLARLADGSDPAAWSEFHSRYGDLIRGFCQRRGLQPADAEDVRQEVLLALSKAMPGFRYDPAKGLFRSYLKTVVVHAISRRFSQKPTASPLSRVPEPGASGEEEHWEAEWRAYHFQRAMRAVSSEFSESDLSAFDLYAVQGRDAKDAALAVGISVDAVYQAKSRILRRLSAIIDQQIGEEG